MTGAVEAVDVNTVKALYKLFSNSNYVLQYSSHFVNIYNSILVLKQSKSKI